MTDIEPTEKGPAARYAYLRTDGTAYIVGGSAVAGIAAYAYQLIGGRTLGADAFAPVSVLLTVHFLTFIVLLLPIEQLVVRRLTLDPDASGLTRPAWILGVLTVVGAIVFAWLGVDTYLNGDYRFVAFTGLTVAAHFLFASGRGHLAGWRRFTEYGLASGGASVLRLLIAIGVTLIHPSASGFAVGLVVGPAVVMLFRPFRQPESTGPHQLQAALSERGLLTGLVLAAAASQALLLGGPIIVGFLGGSAVEISIAFAVFTLGRAPLTFGYNLLARVLPPFTEMAARGERRELKSWARGMALAAAGLSVVAGVAGWLVGDWLVEVAFGQEFSPGRFAAAFVAAGVVLAGASLFVGQILVARNQSLHLVQAWLVGLVTALAAMALPLGLGPLDRVSIGFTVGESVVLIALVAGAVTTRDTSGRMAAYQLAKRTLDIGVALIALTLTLPLLVMTAIAVRIDSPGPIFFRQIRTGRNGREFNLLKIRTMEADQDEEVFAAHLAAAEEARRIGERSSISIADDDRVTRVGKILRKFSIDELANLWNVIEGTMSLVGPRPLVPKEAEVVGLEHPRFSIKPGITGLAQIEGRNISFETRDRLDADYVAELSMALDIQILTKTVRVILGDKGQKSLS